MTPTTSINETERKIVTTPTVWGDAHGAPIWAAKFEGYEEWPIGIGHSEADAIAHLRRDHVCFDGYAPAKRV